MSNHEDRGMVAVSDEVHELTRPISLDLLVLIDKRCGMSPLAGYRHPLHDAFISLETNSKQCLD